MESYLIYIGDVAEKTLLASFLLLTFLYYLCGQPRGAIVMRIVVLAVLIIRAILKEMYSAIVGMVHNMTKDDCYSITYGIPQVAMERPMVTQQAMKPNNSNPSMNIVVTTVNCSNAPIVPKDEIENTPVIVTSPENVQHKKTTETNGCVDYDLLLKSNINRRIVKFDVIDAPAKNVQMKIVWIINSLSEHNLQTKCKEMKNIMTEECFPWISNYLVMERISNKPQSHKLYLKFLDCLSIKSLNLLIKADTVKNIKVLLKRDKTKVYSSFGTLLNNLGHWLGMITLAKNKSIVPIIGDLDTIIVEAYNKGGDELLFTVEFVIKVLESSANSKVFHAKSPWTITVLNCLAEMHQKPDLRLVLKIKIELLCKKLNIELKDLKPGSMLRNPGIGMD